MSRLGEGSEVPSSGHILTPGTTAGVQGSLRGSVKALQHMPSPACSSSLKPDPAPDQTTLLRVAASAQAFPASGPYCTCPSAWTLLSLLSPVFIFQNPVSLPFPLRELHWPRTI